MRKDVMGADLGGLYEGDLGVWRSGDGLSAATLW